MSEKILVVDDEKEITDLISLYLRNENYTVHSFYDSLRAYEAVQEEDFDLVILDVMMPKMDGFMLCQKIREQHNYPIIMLTAKEEEIDKITGLTLGLYHQALPAFGTSCPGKSPASPVQEIQRCHHPGGFPYHYPGRAYAQQPDPRVYFR